MRIGIGYRVVIDSLLRAYKLNRGGLFRRLCLTRLLSCRRAQCTTLSSVALDWIHISSTVYIYSRGNLMRSHDVSGEVLLQVPEVPELAPCYSTASVIWIRVHQGLSNKWCIMSDVPPLGVTSTSQPDFFWAHSYWEICPLWHKAKVLTVDSRDGGCARPYTMLLSNADTYAFGRLNLSEDEGLCDVISLELSELGSRGSTHRENFREHDQSMNNRQPTINLYFNALSISSDTYTISVRASGRGSEIRSERVPVMFQ